MPPSLDLVKIMRAYVDRALSSSAIGASSAGGGASASASSSSSSLSKSGMKTLVLDAATTRAVASAAGQSDLLAAEVYLTEAIENWKRGGEKMAHLKVRLGRERERGREKKNVININSITSMAVFFFFLFSFFLPSLTQYLPLKNLKN